MRIAGELLVEELFGLRLLRGGDELDELRFEVVDDGRDARRLDVALRRCHGRSSALVGTRRRRCPRTAGNDGQQNDGDRQGVARKWAICAVHVVEAVEVHSLRHQRKQC
jgi:hypothetical protein